MLFDPIRGLLLPLLVVLAIAEIASASDGGKASAEPPPITPRPEPAPAVQSLPAKTYPEPAAPQNPDSLGRGIQRTMTLLATSTPTKRNRVRILFYGQSITEQDWSRQVADDLRRRFPHADLEIENRAIGGFASQMLIRPAEHDVYPFYPDLVIFHVYGANQQYEEIIKNIRSRTTAEVLMQRDHVGAQWPAPKATPETDKGLWWDHFMNDTFLPETAKKYGCGLADVRSEWLAYLKANHQEPQALLTDTVHLNDWGNFLMARLIERSLVYCPDLPQTGWENLVRDIPIGGKATEPRWNKRRLVLEFEGNRVDVLAAAGKAGATAKVLIDGKSPSAFSELYAVTPRPEPRPWAGPLALARVDRGDTPLVLEDWTLTVTRVEGNGKRWTYDVAGSVTGPDGSGTSDAPFVSRSGRVRIAPESFFRGFNPPLPVGTHITWKVVPLFTDVYTAPNRSLDPAREHATTLAQGLTNGRHRLELIADDPRNPPALRAIRVYRPPVH